MIKLSPSRKVVPHFIPYICSLLYLIIVVSIIAGVVMLVQKNSLGLLSFFIAFLLILILFILDKIFSWYKSAEIYKGNSFINYNVTNVIGVLGRDVTKYHINNIDFYKWHNNDIIVYGDIEVFEPMMKPKHVKKIKINDATIEVGNLLINYFNL